MKATGIVRRIDDLGRVVIPKEIRRSMGIREGDPLEIYVTNQGEVIFKKYVPLGSIQESAENTYKALKKRGITCAIYTYDGSRLFGNPNTFPTSLDRDELEEMGSRLVPIKCDEDTVGYILATADINQEQKACVKMAADIMTTMLEA